MSKTVSAPLKSHLAENLTTLATAWIITRTDGKVFRFTTASADVTIDVGDGSGDQVYSASEGYKSTAQQNDAELNVSNLDIVGFFDDDAIKNVELRRGLFDFADVRIFVFNYNDTSQGPLKTIRGQLGEALMTDVGFFQVELRDLTQVYSKEFGEHYSKDCRADVGDNRCLVPIDPPELGRDQTVAVGEFYKVRTNPAPSGFNYDCNEILTTFNDADASTTTTNFANNGIDPTFVANAQTDTAEQKFGAGSLLLDGTGDYIAFADDESWTLGGGDFTIDCWVKRNTTGTNQVIASHYRATGNERSWFLRLTAANTVEFQWYDDGGSTSVEDLISTATITDTNWHHIAVTRSGDDFRLFIDGVQEDTVNNSLALHNSTTSLRIGTFDSGGVTDFWDGWIDDFRLVKGVAIWTSGFTPPTSQIPTEDPEPTVADCVVYEDRIYQVVTAGTTEKCLQPTYDTTVGQQTTDGTAVLEAEEAWSRCFTVSAVIEPRRIFRVTELTPNTGGPRGGFPSGWFNNGAAFFDTGDNAGRGVEIRDFIADDGVTIVQEIELFDDLPFAIQVGDTGRAQPGCDKLFDTCINKFDNVLNFVGEPFVPGSDTLGKYPDARS